MSKLEMLTHAEQRDQLIDYQRAMYQGVQSHDRRHEGVDVSGNFHVPSGISCCGDSLTRASATAPTSR